MISSQSYGSAESQQLILGVTYQHHAISKVYSKNEQVNNPTQRRSTDSFLLEANYGLTPRLSLTGTSTYLQKTRETGLISDSPTETISTCGVGDGSLLLKYLLHPME
jgi:predicted porin